MNYTDDPELLARIRRDREILFKNIQGRCRQQGMTFAKLSERSGVPLYIFQILEACDIQVDFDMEYVVRICYYLDVQWPGDIFKPGRYYDEEETAEPPAADPQP